MLRISQIKLRAGESVELLPQKIGASLKIRDFKPESWRIVKESVDARKKPDIKFIYSVDFECADEEKLLIKAEKLKGVNLTKANRKMYTPVLSGYEKTAVKNENEQPSPAEKNTDTGKKPTTKLGNRQLDEKSDVRKKICELPEDKRPVIVGFGPCGMFAGIILAEAGLRPVILERGRKVDQRTSDVEHFWKTGELNVNSNVQYGEGGAGTFSDGKLTTGIKDPRISKVNDEFILAGADESIAYAQMPHIGTDVLREVVKNIREKIISLGGEVRFETQVTDVLSQNGKITGLVCVNTGKTTLNSKNSTEYEKMCDNDNKNSINDTAVSNSVNIVRKKDSEVNTTRNELLSEKDECKKSDVVQNIYEKQKYEIACENVIFALGNSARDTFRMMYRSGVKFESKPFSAGVRIEHPQLMINESQYGKNANDSEGRLGAAAYKLSHHCADGRGVYTFCMCPGGFVVGAASEEGGVVTNGMSYFARDGKNANSALLAGVEASDCFKVVKDAMEKDKSLWDYISDEAKKANSAEDYPLIGIDFQEVLEHRAFAAGGGGYFAPAQTVGSFMQSGGADVKMAAELENNDAGGIAETAVIPTYQPGVRWKDMSECLPEFIISAMKEALPQMARKIHGFDMEEAVMTGVETRSSSPVRIPRTEECESVSMCGLYPAGEGAGYAGGIMSAAVDGIKIAEKIIGKLSIK